MKILDRIIGATCLILFAVQVPAVAADPFQRSSSTLHACSAAYITASTSYGVNGALQLFMSTRPDCQSLLAPVYLCSTNATAPKCAAGQSNTFRLLGEILGEVARRPGRSISVDGVLCNDGSFTCPRLVTFMAN